VTEQRQGSLAGDEILSLRDVDVSLAGRYILRGVNASVRAGQLTGLIGSNGSGKTTLLRVILGLQGHSAGEVRVAGRRMAGRRGPAIGYVPQTVVLDPDLPLRARDVVSLGLDGHRFGVPIFSGSRRALVDDMLTAVDAQRFADVRVGLLSGGEKQRVLIAHALIGRPSLLLLDEPFANLDIRGEEEIVALLTRVAQEQSVAVIASTHDMNPLLPVMDRIIYLGGGRAVSGTIDEVGVTARNGKNRTLSRPLHPCSSH
jgi:zinc/manganese transport system ATP-binding protein